uniref:BED-type domain-containing protein n=1 Tax=Aegilops tauschii subsp. strangulata TaxID=200361 RepID=A0A453CZW3_AEGTS
MHFFPGHVFLGTVASDERQGVDGAERVNEIPRGDAATRNSSVGKLRSLVWEHFTITQKDDGKPVKAKCTYCTEEFRCETKTNGTSSMRNHLEKEHSVICTKRPGAHPPNLSSTGEPIVIGSSSKGKGKKRRSKAWDSFDVIKEVNGQPIKARCKYCPTEIKCGTGNGTAGMLNHNKICKKKPGLDDQPPNSSSTNDTTANDATTNARPNLIGDSSSRKRRRVDEESAQNIAANTSTPWNKAELSNRIQQIISRLQDIRGEVSEVFKLHESDSASSLDHNR